jgi:3-hydroxyisobutyrate dehydrogenase
MRRLMQRGSRSLVWNRDRKKASALLEAGAKEAASPAELTRASTFIITCVSDGAALEKVVFAEQGVAEGAAGGQILVDMSTCAPAHNATVAARSQSAECSGWMHRSPEARRLRWKTHGDHGRRTS